MAMQAPEPGGAPLPHYLGVIGRARLRAWWRRLRRQRLGLLGLLAALSVTLLAGGGLAAASYGLGRGMSRAGQSLPAALARLGLPAGTLPLLVPNMVFVVGWLGLFFLSFASLLGTLYLRRDLPLLLVAPVPVRAVFTAQFLEALALPLFWTLALGLPTLWGFGLGMGYGPPYFLLSLALLLLLPLVPLGLAAAATLLLLRLVPAPRASEILTILGTLLGVSIWLASQSLGDLLQRLDPSGQALVRGGVGLTNPLLPWAWAARGMAAAGQGALPAALAFAALFAALSLGTLAASVLLAERLTYDGWLAGGATTRRGRRARAAGGGGREPFARLLPRPALAIARKDWRLMRRDPRGYAALIWIFAMLLFWGWRLASGRSEMDLPLAGLSSAPVFALLASLAPVGLALLFSGMRWGMESISRDQRSFQILQAAPVSPRDMVLGKWLGAFLPSLALAALVLGVFSAASGQLAPWTLGRNLLIVVPILAAETSVMLAVGAARPNFEWTDPKEMAGGMLGCLGALAAWGYVGLSLAIVALGFVLPALAGLPPAAGLLGWALATGLALVVQLTAFTFAAERLAAVEL